MADKGIVACFDILGYQNIIDTNQIEYVAELISNKISKLPDQAHKMMSEMLIKEIEKRPDGAEKTLLTHLAKIGDKINYLSISDTVIASITFEANQDEMLAFVYWYFFLAQMAMLQRVSFDAGVPMRGAIDFGEFYFHGNSFAGKPIIDSFRLSQQLNFSGCALTNSTGHLLLSQLAEWKKQKDIDTFDLYKEVLMPYLAPLKDASHQKLLLLNWINPAGNWPATPQDIKQYINTAFHDHNKEVDASAAVKIDNTERIVRWMKECKWHLHENCLGKNS